MQILRNIRRRAALFLWPSIATCVLIYFSYHFIQGDRGLLAWQKLEKQLKVRENKLKELQNAHHHLEHRVTLMRKNICADLLDEQAKSVLGYIHPHEVIVRREDITPLK